MTSIIREALPAYPAEAPLSRFYSYNVETRCRTPPQQRDEEQVFPEMVNAGLDDCSEQSLYNQRIFTNIIRVTTSVRQLTEPKSELILSHTNAAQTFAHIRHGTEYVRLH